MLRKWHLLIYGQGLLFYFISVNLIERWAVTQLAQTDKMFINLLIAIIDYFQMKHKVVSFHIVVADVVFDKNTLLVNLFIIYAETNGTNKHYYLLMYKHSS